MRQASQTASLELSRKLGEQELRVYQPIPSKYGMQHANLLRQLALIDHTTASKNIIKDGSNTVAQAQAQSPPPPPPPQTPPQQQAQHQQTQQQQPHHYPMPRLTHNSASELSSAAGLMLLSNRDDLTGYYQSEAMDGGVYSRSALKASRDLQGEERTVPFTKEEDMQLERLVRAYKGEDKIRWAVVASSLKNRTGKQCRERWCNQLKPGIRRDIWTPEEDRVIIDLHKSRGGRWAEMARLMEGRTENAIKNRWNSAMRRVTRARQQGQSQQLKRKRNLDSSESKDILFEYCFEFVQAHPEKMAKVRTPERYKRRRKSSSTGLEDVAASTAPGATMSGTEAMATSAVANNPAISFAPELDVLPALVDLQKGNVGVTGVTNVAAAAAAAESEKLRIQAQIEAMVHAPWHRAAIAKVAAVQPEQQQQRQQKVPTAAAAIAATAATPSSTTLHKPMTQAKAVSPAIAVTTLNANTVNSISSMSTTIPQQLKATEALTVEEAQPTIPALPVPVYGTAGKEHLMPRLTA
eukprot:g61040.t1